MYDEKYYQDKAQKLSLVSKNIIQRFINSAYEFVSDANNNAEAIQELAQQKIISQAKQAKEEESKKVVKDTEQQVNPIKPKKE